MVYYMEPDHIVFLSDQVCLCMQLLDSARSLCLCPHQLHAIPPEEYVLPMVDLLKDIARSHYKVDLQRAGELGASANGGLP
jgi:hypothetical protein